MLKMTENSIRARIGKAMKKTKGDTLMVKALTTKEMVRMTDFGFEVVSNLSLGRGAGFQQYIMKVKRSDLDLTA